MKSIQFNTQMVQAILEGRKTVTRRVIKTDLPKFLGFGYDWVNIDKAVFGFSKYGHMEAFKQPFEVGDILYVKESWSEVTDGIIEYKATYIEPYTSSTEIDHVGRKIKWLPASKMPKDAARIFLMVTDVRVQKLFNMTEDDAIKEGYKDDEYDNTPLMKFWRAWNKRVKREDIGITNFEVNPFVFVIDFKMIDRNR